MHAEKGFGRNIEIIIVNNGTGDSNLFEKVSKFPHIRIINPKSNLGFSAGVNLGIMASNNNLVMLLNPDTLVEVKSINSLASCLRKNNAGIAGGTNYTFDEGKHNSFVRKPTMFTYLFDYTNLRKIIPGDYFHKKHYYLDEPFPVGNITVDAVSGSFMLIDKKVINKIGLFDERYFMYLEDVDYCLMAIKAGFKVIFCPKSSIKHIGGHSSKNKEKTHISAWLESRRNFVKKHENLLTNMLIQPIFLIDSIIIEILHKLKK